MARSTTTPSTRRADAIRNIERTLDAAIVCLSEQPNATMADIAKAAGLGRVTLYGHFASRVDLLDAVVTRLIAQGEEVLVSVDLHGDALDALMTLATTSWQLIDQSHSIVSVATKELSPARMRELHNNPAQRVEALIERGRRSGSIRTDMPSTWQLAIVHQILHGAATEVSEGRLESNDAPALINQTMRMLLAAGKDKLPK